MNYVAAREYLYNYDFESIITGDKKDTSRYTKVAKMLPLYLELDSNELSKNNKAANRILLNELLDVVISDLFEYGDFDTVLEVSCLLISQFNNMEDIQRRDILFRPFLEKLHSYSSTQDLTMKNGERLYIIRGAYGKAFKNDETSWYDDGRREVKLDYFELEAAVQMNIISEDDIHLYLDLVDSKLEQVPADAYILEEYRGMLGYRLDGMED